MFFYVSFLSYFTFLPSIDWATHGICGRGVLLDLVAYHTKNGGNLPYDPWTTHAITVADLEAVARSQNVQFRTGDILLLRVGFIQKYYKVATEERNALASRPETLSVFIFEYAKFRGIGGVTIFLFPVLASSKARI